MPAKRNTNLAARADRLRVGDVVVQRHMELTVERITPKPSGFTGTPGTVAVRYVGVPIPYEYGERHMLSIARFAPATDDDFKGL